MLPVLGIAAAAMVDVLLPLVLSVLLTRWNLRRWRAGAGDGVLWVLAVLHLAFLGLAVWRGIDAVFGYMGEPVIAVTLVSGPAGLIPLIFNTGVLHYFFTAAEWAGYGYFIVLTMYVGGLVAWAFLGHAAVHALAIQARLADERRRIAAGVEWDALQGSAG